MYDVHSHFVPEAVLRWLKTHANTVHAVWEQRAVEKEPFLTVNHRWSFELKRAFYDANEYLAAQRAAGIGHTLVSPIPQLFLYDFPPEATSELSSVYNRELALWIQAHGDRLSGLGTVPLNHPEAAARELEAAMSQGLKGVIIGPGHNGILLSNPRFTPFWEAANDHGAVVFIHPLLNEDPRIQRKMMPNLIGIPWETTIAALDLVLGGILDAYPNAKLLLAHGGGFLPYQVGRLNQGHAVWPQVSSSLQDSPEGYLKRFWYDNVLWHEAALSYLQTLVGEERVLPGSDYPFDLKTWPPAPASDEAVREFLGIGANAKQV
ncbi:amidohydrolase [Alicyclobacillus contaminans]|uniref:amidohydrolase family protein n=1 Tax=Alicyclobacillus contaminans TaxID=392016 RepID=UPI000408DF74|nr:amidohydrolase family protein [Alicyclobacillus contaminans]GMA49702.1 amidohydrolase [Alicyclobacillus contaminans]